MSRSAKERKPLPISRRWAELFVVLAGLITLAVLLAAVPTFRSWSVERLGYGLVPVACWAAALVLALRFRPKGVKRRYRLWLASALLVAVILAMLSWFRSADGILADATFGGHWGQALGGRPLALGILKLGGLLVLAPLALAPRRAAMWYVTGGKRLLLALWLPGRVLARKTPVSMEWLRQRWPWMPGEPKETEPDGPLSSKERMAAPKATRVQGNGKKEPHPSGGAVSNGRTEERTAAKPPTPAGWPLPSTDLLSRGENRSVPQGTLQEIARRIEVTLHDHGVEVSVQNIRTGPRVIRFGLVPGWVNRYREPRSLKSRDKDSPLSEMNRVKVHSIVAREQDLALALKTPYLRIEAPVPGEALVGLEVPNPNPTRVHMRTVAESEPFQQIAARGGLALGLGEDTGGQPLAVDLIEMPHLLIAGATGSGKSVCINALITSLLLTSGPDKLRMLMVDPKRVELTPFNGIPHLLKPVIVDHEEVLKVLSSVLREMFHRYKLLEGSGVRNIEGYNAKSKDHMPYLLLVIDELADLMIAAAFEMEQALVRLAQLGRATGIHLILCTQRPSVNVVTGLMKANVATRIAFAVASQVDSRVILDGNGAEKLLGKGDMLFLSSDSPKPRRIQGTYVSDKEIERVVRFWTGQKGPPLPAINLEEAAEGDASEADGMEDDLLDKARELATRQRHLSPSLLQRRLQIGYPRALRLMELLEEEGVVAKGEPGKSRAVMARGGTQPPF